MDLIVLPGGEVRCLYGEQIDLAAIGTLHIERASNVEPDRDGNWLADLSPVSGPVLGPFTLRSQALTAEVEWLEANRLCCPLSN